MGMFNQGKNNKGEPDVLDHLVPRAGGVLAFQAGFNTKMPMDVRLQQDIWDRLAAKVNGAGGKIILVSNAFSFGGEKAGRIETSSSFLVTLKEQSELLWSHLIQAGS